MPYIKPTLSAAPKGLAVHATLWLYGGGLPCVPCALAAGLEGSRV